MEEEIRNADCVKMMCVRLNAQAATLIEQWISMHEMMIRMRRGGHSVAIGCGMHDLGKLIDLWILWVHVISAMPFKYS